MSRRRFANSYTYRLLAKSTREQARLQGGKAVCEEVSVQLARRERFVQAGQAGEATEDAGGQGGQRGVVHNCPGGELGI